MWRYVLKRVLIFLPTLLVITLISFMIMQSAPGDPVQRMLEAGPQGQNLQESQVSEAEYIQKRKELGLDRPLFYFALSTLAEPDTLYRIPRPKTRETLQELIYTYGNWAEIQDYHHALEALDRATLRIPSDSATNALRLEWQTRLTQLKTLAQATEIERDIKWMQTSLSKHPEVLQPVAAPFKQYASAFTAMKANSSTWKVYIPKVMFYGSDNQYHNWLMKVFTLDFGTSYKDSQPVGEKLLSGLKWSLALNIPAILIMYMIAIPIGVYSARNRNSLGDNISTVLLFIFYSMPSFWVAVMAIIYLSSPDYLEIFPASGVESMEHSADWSFGKKFGDWVYHLTLPVLVFVLPTFAFLSRQMRVGMLEVLSADYVRTAWAKGLGKRKVVWKHAFRNSLIPIITLFASIFPMMVGGSIIIETIFTIPGMGKLSYDAIFARDYPMIVAVFTLAAIMTLVGILVADILYAAADPRISYSKNK